MQDRNHVMPLSTNQNFAGSGESVKNAAQLEVQGLTAISVVRIATDEPNSGNSVDDSGSEMDDFYVEKAQPLQSTAETPMPAHEPEADIRTTSHCPELPETGAEPHGDLPPPPQYGGMSSIDYFCNLDHVAGPSAADPGPQYAGTEDAGESTDHDSASTQPLTIDDSDDKPDAESCAPPCP